jgi:cell division protein FtsZ
MKMEFLSPNSSSNIIKVVGVGGGGSNAVNHMFLQGITGVDFIVCNTDNQALALSPVPTKVQLGPALTHGRGAGSLPDVGKDACSESADEIHRLLMNNTKMLFITAGMGGGTGTGAAPVIAKLARELDILTVGIVTKPFKFEGKRRHIQAVNGLEQLKKNVDTLIVIDNERLREIYGDLGLRDAFGNADDILTTAAKAIAEIITVPGYINVDFADVNTVMRNSGVAIMGVGVAEGADRARSAIDMALTSPLLEESNIRGAQHILLNISSGTREVTMDEIMEITDFVQEEAGEGTDVIWGNCYNESLGDRLCVTLIATGFEHNGTRIKDGRVVVDMEGDLSHIGARPTGLNDILAEDKPMRPGVSVDLGGTRPRPPEHSPRPAAPIAGTGQTPVRHPGQLPKLSSPKVISELENEPAYLRKGVKLDDVAHSSEEPRSRLTVNASDEPDLFSSMPFLHEKDGID